MIILIVGRNKKLGLSGRSSRDVGILSTSKLYSLQDRIFAFTPQKLDMTHFYNASDHELMIDILKSEINFLKSSWQNMLGRPLVIINMKSMHLGESFECGACVFFSKLTFLLITILLVQ